MNLFSSLYEMKKTFTENKHADNVYEVLKNKAEVLQKDDIDKCERIGKNGLTIFKKKSNVLTHCNTGKLATAGDGTAFNVIRLAL